MLGTDGFGRSDYRKALRAHFEVDRHYVAVASLKALADQNKIPSLKVAEAIAKYGIDPDKPNPARAKSIRASLQNLEEEDMSSIEVKVPDIGDYKNVPIIEVHVKPGQTGKGRRPADHARKRQGGDGCSSSARRHGRNRFW